MGRIQKIRDARQRDRSRRRRHHRRGVRSHRHVARRRHHHAIVGAVTGGLDFSNYYTPLSAKVDASAAYADAKKQGAVLGWGQFLTAAINFLIIAWVLFLAIKGINRLKREEPAAPAEPTAEVKLLTEIRDLLRR